VRRRDFMKALGMLSATMLFPAGRRLNAAAQAPDASKTMAFSAGDVQKQARALAAEKFVPPKIDLPKQLQDIGNSTSSSKLSQSDAHAFDVQMRSSTTKWPSML
jgi:glucan biosynthesis protein